jgi:hypothetical protein
MAKPAPTVALHEATAADAALAILRTEPLRVEMAGRHPNEYSIEIWYEETTFKEITCDGSVGISGGPGRLLDWWPDFAVVEGAQIREIVSALLSAHNWTLSHPEGHRL